MRDEAREAYEAWLKATDRTGPAWLLLPWAVREMWDRATQAAMRRAEIGATQETPER